MNFESETEGAPVAEVPFTSRRPRTASGLMLAEYEFGHSFKEGIKGCFQKCHSSERKYEQAQRH